MNDIREIPVPANASKTFHGRDVFAGAAANINLGHFDDVGRKIREIEKLELHRDGRQGTIVRIDSFGNIVTNLPREEKATHSVTIERRSYRMNVYPTYLAAKDDELFLIEGSCRTLEISLKNGSANERLHVEAGSKVEIS